MDFMKKLGGGGGDKTKHGTSLKLLQGLDDENMTAGYQLQDLAGRGDIKEIKELLEMPGAAQGLANWKDSSGWTALHEACSTAGNTRTVETVRVLLDHGADPSAKDENGTTCLHTACDNGDVATAKLLMEVGAERAPKSTSFQDEDAEKFKRQMLLELDADGKTPFHCAE